MFSPRRRIGRPILGFLTAAAVLFYLGDQRRAVPASSGTSLSGENSATARAHSTFRLATFNIHGGTGRDRRCDLARTAEVLHNYDFVLLNEVHGPYFWQSAGQVEQLAAQTGKHWLFAPTEERWWHHRYGNAVLADAKVNWWQCLPLPTGGGRHRNLVLMAVPHQGRTIHLVATHLERGDEQARSQQLAMAAEFFLALEAPAVLLGDLNTTADEGPLEALLSRDDVHDPLDEILGEGTPRHIDWILTRGLKTVAAGIIDNGASDHPLVWAEFE